MDTKQLLSDIKARFAHNSAKAYLKDKYESKLIVADQGGLWKADYATINFLNAFDDDHIALIDKFDNLVVVNRKELLEKLKTLYTQVTNQWHEEWKELEAKR